MQRAQSNLAAMKIAKWRLLSTTGAKEGHTSSEGVGEPACEVPIHWKGRARFDPVRQLERTVVVNLVEIFFSKLDMR